MKKFVLAIVAICVLASLHAQQKEGKITYERTTTFQISFGGGMENAAPRTRTDRFELNFANNKMSWKQMEDDIQDDAMNSGGGGGGFQIRTLGGGDNMTYCDFSIDKKVDQLEFLDKKFIISDSIRKLNWKLSEETKTILDHVCRKAVAQRVSKRMSMSMQNGKTERKEVDDTSAVVAWFTTDIPVSAGPEVAGQLPGVILELNMSDGRVMYKATEISAKPNLTAIKEPTKGKKVTPAEFTAERNKMMEEMQKNRGGGNTIQIRMN